MDSFAQLAEYLESGGKLSLLSDVPQDEMDNIFATAHNLLKRNSPARAGSYFALLAFMDHHNIEYWIGLGVSRQAMGQHKAAIVALSKAMQYASKESMPDTRPLELMAISLGILGELEKSRSCDAMVANVKNACRSNRPDDETQILNQE